MRTARGQGLAAASKLCRDRAVPSGRAAAPCKAAIARAPPARPTRRRTLPRPCASRARMSRAFISTCRPAPRARRATTPASACKRAVRKPGWVGGGGNPAASRPGARALHAESLPRSGGLQCSLAPALLWSPPFSPWCLFISSFILRVATPNPTASCLRGLRLIDPKTVNKKVAHRGDSTRLQPIESKRAACGGRCPKPQEDVTLWMASARRATFLVLTPAMEMRPLRVR